MIKQLMELAAGIGFGFAKRGARDRAFSSLLKGGILPAGASIESKAVKSLLRQVGKKGFDPRVGGGKLLFHSAVKGSQLHGLATLQTKGATQYAIDFARQGFGRAARELATSRAFGGAETLMFGLPAVAAGFSMFAQSDRFFEKNIPPELQGDMQQQQMFLPRQAYTQRQRAIQAIHQSGITTRSALGNEAAYMHG